VGGLPALELAEDPAISHDKQSMLQHFMQGLTDGFFGTT